MRTEQIAWLEWDQLLQAMANIGRASKYQAFKDPLALLGLVYLRRRDRVSLLVDKDNTASSIALRLAEAIEEHSALQGQPLSQHLLSGFLSIEPSVVNSWLRIASENWPIEGFPEWFAAKLDELGFAYHHDTPSSLSRLVASLFADQSPSTIFDPACGTGGFLSAISEKMGQATLFGQEVSSEAWAWAELRFLVRGLGDIKLANGNALTDRAFTRLAPKNGFDLVLTNPPFGIHLDSETRSLLSRHPNRIAQPSGRLLSETAYVQEILGSLSRTGVAAVIVPNGFLFRGGPDQRLREVLVQDDVLQAIIGLPQRLFAPGTSIETAILILNRGKPDDQKERVLFVDGRGLGRRDGSRLILDDDAADRIKSRYSQWQDEVGFSQIVSFERLDPTSLSFSPALYVKQPPRMTKMSPDDQRSRIIELEACYAMLCEEYETIRARLARSD